MKTCFSLNLSVFLIFIVSCSKQQADQAVYPIIINVDVSQVHNDSLNLSEIADKIEYIPLQTSDSVLLEDIFKMNFTDDFIFLQNGKYRFDRNGNFMNVIYKSGHGPEEIIPMCSAVSQEGTVYVYGINYCLNIYNSSGNYINTVKNPFARINVSFAYNIDFFKNYLIVPNVQIPTSRFIYSCYNIENDSIVILCKNYRRYNKSQMNQWPSLIPPDYHYQVMDSLLLFKEHYSDTIYCRYKF